MAINDKGHLIKRLLWDLRTYWRLLFIVLVPIVLSPLPLISRTPPANCAYVVLIMILYWVAEALPLPVAALIPLVLFPLLGVETAGAIATQYTKDGNWLFFGSLMMALGVEQSQLHQRVGLIILTKIGSSPRRLMLGFMISTCFLSMWMSNTATTAMMVPLVLAVTDELLVTEEGKSKPQDPVQEDGAQRMEPVAMISKATSGEFRKEIQESERVEFTPEISRDPTLEQFKRIRKGLLLSVCYSANIGGTGTLTGTSSNVVLVGQLQNRYEAHNIGLTFANWMTFSFPQMIIILMLAWLWLQTLYIGFKGITKKRDARELLIRAVLQKKYNELKPMSFAEKATLSLFVLLVLLWLFRAPGFINGWGDLFPPGYASDGTAAMAITLLLFVVPKELPKITLFSGIPRGSKASMSPLLTWDNVQKGFPWGVVILLGGGYAMAAGVTKSGLDSWISSGLIKLDSVPPSVFVVITVILVTFLTEFCSNVAIASIFIPIGISVAEHMMINPVYVALPIAIACSFAFMLPVATPPNLIVFGTGLVRVLDMVLAGFVMNIICIIVLLININTYACWLLECHTYPAWAKAATNSSAILGRHNSTGAF